MDNLILVFEKHDQPMTDSRTVAAYFGRRHADVINSIERIFIDADADFTQRHFSLSAYRDESGKRNKMYNMTKDGFILLVMGFTGKKAMELKVKYINQFNKMADFIKQLQTAKLESKDFVEAIRQAHEELHAYHFSTEFDMINRIVLGVSSKKFKQQNGIKGDSIRPFLNERQLDHISRLQRFDMGLMVAVPDYTQRKQMLTDYYNKAIKPQRLAVGA